MPSDTAAAHGDSPDRGGAEPTVRDEARALFRASVLDAAEAEFAAHGFEGARMQDVAKRARVAVGTVYNHFANKDELLAAVLAARARSAADAFAPRPEDGASFEDRFFARFTRLHGFFAEHVAFFGVIARHGMLGDESRTAPCGPDALPLDLTPQVEALLREGMAEGALAPNDPSRLARFLKGATKMVLIGAAHEGSIDVVGNGRWVLETFLRGASARGSTAPVAAVAEPPRRGPPRPRGGRS